MKIENNNKESIMKESKDTNEVSGKIGSKKGVKKNHNRAQSHFIGTSSPM